MRIANWTNFKGTIKVGDRTNSKKAAHLFFFYLQLYKDVIYVKYNSCRCIHYATSGFPKELVI